MGITLNSTTGDHIAVFYDAKGRRRVRHRKTASAAAQTMIRLAGPRSAGELGELPLSEYVTVYLEDLAARGGTFIVDKLQHREVEKWLGKEVLEAPVGTITPPQLSALLDDWMTRQHAPTTVRNRTYLIERIFDCAWAHHAVTRNPARTAFAHRRQFYRGPRAAALPADRDVALLRQTTDPRRRALIELVLSTRPSGAELCVLRPSDIDLDDGPTGTVTYAYVMDRGREVEHANPYRVRTVPLGAAREYLRVWLESPARPESAYVFPDERGKRSRNENDRQLRRHQWELGLLDENRRRGPRVEVRANRTSAFVKAVVRYGLKDLGNVAVIAWYEEGLRGLALAQRVGCSLRGLDKFQSLFDELDQDLDAVRRAGNMLGGSE